jgi:ribonucleoside-diphosphate reductase beta chain
MSVEQVSEDASLQELQHTPIDSVLQSIDDGLVHLPSYRELYYRWERQHWQARDIDFRLDALQWQHMSTEEQDHLLGVISAFFQGEASVTDALAPYIIAMPDEEKRFYVTTQLVDETRHTIFFDRFFREVLRVGEEKIEERLLMAQQFMNGAMRFILLDALLDMAQRLRREPENRELLIEGVTLYHILTEGTMGLAGQRHLLEYFRKKNLFPGFRGGFTAVARDESRHVLFGVKFLREMIQQDPAYAAVVHRALATYAPLALDALAPTEGGAVGELDPEEDPWQPQRYGYRSLSKKLKVIGLTVDLSAFVAPGALM